MKGLIDLSSLGPFTTFHPEGISIETIGSSVSTKRFMTCLNASRTGGLKLNPKRPSTMNRYFLTVMTSGQVSMNGMSMKVHCVTKLLNSGLSVLLG